MALASVMDIYDRLAKKLRQERSRAGLSLEQLAGSAGISPSFLAYIEGGKRKPSLATVGRLAAALGLLLADLFQEEKKPAKTGADYRYIRQFASLLRDRAPREKEALLSAAKAVSKSLKS